MANDGNGLDELVEVALDQCEEDFRRGVNSHGWPTFEVPQATIDWLRCGLTKYFKGNLGGQKPSRRWHTHQDGDGPRVTRMAFYLGAIAAFHAHAESESAVTKKHSEAALIYVREQCKAVVPQAQTAQAPVFRAQWIYCDSASATRSSAASARQKGKE